MNIDNGAKPASEMTKRETMALEIMVAALSNPETKGRIQDIADLLPAAALQLTEALLKELDK